jgi:hypothetical protein
MWFTESDCEQHKGTTIEVRTRDLWRSVDVYRQVSVDIIVLTRMSFWALPQPK